MSAKLKCAPSPNHGGAYFGMQLVGDGRSGRSYRDHQHKPQKPQKPLLMCEMCGYKGHTKVQYVKVKSAGLAIGASQNNTEAPNPIPLTHAIFFTQDQYHQIMQMMSMESEKGGEHSTKAVTEGLRPIIASTYVERPTNASSTGVRRATASTFGERHTSATSTGVRPTISSTSKERPTSATLTGVRLATNLLGTQQSTSSVAGQKRKSNTTLKSGTTLGYKNQDKKKIQK
ncbi:hypothetical protein RDI58_024719 [Solanum bulbocastanum]|uniref:Uncharacterized protein n=1 Tax=Solanum bulbocastanum TaxID=147425 RepID=A0AAN8Y3X2_SOLBU